MEQVENKSKIVALNPTISVIILSENELKTYMSYLLLKYKLPPNIKALKNKHLFFHSFIRLRIQERLSWVIMVRISHEMAIRMLAGAAVI